MTSKPHLLLIDDEPSRANLIRMILERSDCTLEVVTDGLQGITAMRRRKPDIVLLDLLMPVTNGWQVYEIMKNEQDLADIPVIILSVLDPPEDGILVPDLPPVEAYLKAPWLPQDLMASIAALLPEDRHLTPPSPDQ
ncbi:MAG: response regulator transcription factor [Anaerolineae bacterium]